MAVCLWENNRIITIRVLCDSCDNRHLRNGKISAGLIKVSVCSGFDTIYTLSQVNGIQVSLHDLLFCVYLLEIHGKILLLNLTFNLLYLCGLVHTNVENLVLYELLSYCRRTLVEVTSNNVLVHCSEDTLHINTVVCPESFVLNGNKCIYQLIWNIIIVDVYTV